MGKDALRADQRHAVNDSEPDFAGFAYLRFALLFFAALLLTAWVALVPLLRAAALGPEAKGAMLVVFPPGLGEPHAFSAIHNAGGLPIRRTGLGNIWVVQAIDPGFVGEVQVNGAVAAYRDLPFGVVLAGCSGVIAVLDQ